MPISIQKISETLKRKVWDFLSSSLGLLMLGFVLTTVVGSYLVQEFQRASRLKEIRFIHLHEERVRAIKALHGKIIDVENILKAWNYTYRPVGITPQFVKAEDAIAQVRELRTLFDKKRIYFSSDLSSMIDSVVTGFEEMSWEWEVAELNCHANPQCGVPDFGTARFLEIQLRAEVLGKQLDKKLKTLLGVDEAN